MNKTAITDQRIAELDAIGMGLFYSAPIATAVTVEAGRRACIDHPDAGSYPGFGYAGGGFGSYLRCSECHIVFGKAGDIK